MKTRIVENIYKQEDLDLIVFDARDRLSNHARVNKVGNKFAESEVRDLVTSPLGFLGCGSWYVAYFEHVTAVYPHTDNDDPNMKCVTIIPLYWTTADDPHTIIHNETSESKVILKDRTSVTDEVDYRWALNSGVSFDANRLHSSDEFKGIKAGIQVIGYR